MSTNELEALRLQKKLFLQLPGEERWNRFFEMIAMGFGAVEASIKKNNPTISAIDLKVETFKRIYKHDFTPERLDEICNWFRECDRKQIAEQNLTHQ